MASIASDPGGFRRLQFKIDGKRLTVRLGKMASKQADAVKVRVERLVSALLSQQPPDDETSRWVAALPGALRSKLAKAGLPVGSAPVVATLADLDREFFAATSVRPITETTYRQTTDGLLAFFGPARPVRDLGPLDAEKWRQSLVAAGLAEATVSKRVKVAKQVFRRAVKWHMTADSPFSDVRAGSQANRSRMRYISRADIARVLDACPDAEWRLIVALARFGGVRCPSELKVLRWQDVNWDRRSVLVRSTKTGDRVMPLFPDLHPHLLDAYDLAPDGAVYAVPRARQTAGNLRTQFCRIIARAGLVPWPKPFINLRSTRLTELADQHPGHVVTAWLGNSEKIAEAHYLQVTDAHFAKALEAPTMQGRTMQDGGAEAAQKAAQHPAEHGRTDPQPDVTEAKNPQQMPGGSAVFYGVQGNTMTPVGLEPTVRA